MQETIERTRDANPLVLYGRIDEWTQLMFDMSLLRKYLASGLSPREALAAFRGELCPVVLPTRAA